MKVSELSGAQLDYWVARAQGWQKWDAYPDCWLTGDKRSPSFQHFHPSTDWSIGGPIIERERITIGDGYAECGEFWSYGPTPLTAAMRAYVESKFGEEVEDAPQSAG